MAGGGVLVHGGSQNYNGGMSTFVVLACVVAAMGGLIFGYDLGISGTCIHAPNKYCIQA